MSPDNDEMFREVAGQILAEVTDCVSRVSAESLAQAAAMVEAAPRIFVAGSGRSGLCIRALGMRLMHLGKSVYIVGETTTPSITSKDLLILGSGSGQSAVLLKMAEQAKQQGARLLLFTAESISPLSMLSDQLVIIPAPSLKPTPSLKPAQPVGVGPSPKPAEAERILTSQQPLGSLFEQSLLIVGDSLVIILMDQIGVGVGKMRKHHANLE